MSKPVCTALPACSWALGQQTPLLMFAFWRMSVSILCASSRTTSPKTINLFLKRMSCPNAHLREGCFAPAVATKVLSRSQTGSGLVVCGDIGPLVDLLAECSAWFQQTQVGKAPRRSLVGCHADGPFEWMNMNQAMKNASFWEACVVL